MLFNLEINAKFKFRGQHEKNKYYENIYQRIMHTL